MWFRRLPGWIGSWLALTVFWLWTGGQGTATKVVAAAMLALVLSQGFVRVAVRAILVAWTIAERAPAGRRSGAAEQERQPRPEGPLWQLPLGDAPAGLFAPEICRW